MDVMIYLFDSLFRKMLPRLRRDSPQVVCNCSGVFRDLFINQMNLLDRAIKATKR